MKRLYRETFDLVVVVLWTLLTAGAVLVNGVEPSAVRALLVLPLVLLLPGYGLVAVLYPAHDPPGAERDQADVSPGIGSIERFALSIALSLGLVASIAFVLNFTAYGIRLRPVMAGVAGVTVGLAVLGLFARFRVPVENRPPSPVAGLAWLVAAPGSYLTVERNYLASRAFEPESGTQRLFNLILVGSLLVLAASVGYAAVAAPSNDEQFTEFYLLTQDDSGSFTGDNLPHEFDSGESRPLYVTFANHEGRQMRYTTVVTLEGEEIDRFRTTVGPGVTKRVRRPIGLDQAGDRQRLSFLLYTGDPPDNPTPRNAYRQTRLYVTVNG